MVSGFGEKGVTAVAVARVRPGGGVLRAGVPVGAHLADQLLVPMAVAGGGGSGRCRRAIRGRMPR